MKYAVINVNGNQYKVSEGEELLLEGANSEPGEKLKLESVLLIVDGDKVKLGEPQIKGTSVTAEVLGQEKGRKLKVFKFKAKSRYRRTRGHRSSFTRVKVTKISSTK